MDDLAVAFEAHRPHLRAVAYRMLGSVSEAEDAVQEAWLRLSRSDADAVQNLGGWLTTVVSRICLDALRARREEPYGDRMPDPVVTELAGDADPEREALLADSVGLALLVVLEALGPAERLAFVLHDMFGLPFEEIAPIVDRSPAAARQLASRARRRVRGAVVEPDDDVTVQREVVEAFLAAARGGDLEALIACLDPDVVLRAENAVGAQTVRGAEAVASRAMGFAALASHARPVRVNGGPGFAVAVGGRPRAVAGFTIAGGRIVEIDVLADPERLARLL
jgi:RNA polymerase sigma-70 factor (ECF subfamily)